MSSRQRLRRWFTLTLLLLTFAERPSEAVDLRNVLTDYTFTSWSRKDGLSGPVWAIAQDAEGFLWVGNDDGLLRFDGVRFVPWERLGGQPLPRLTVRALTIAGDGSIWVGFGGVGGVTRLRNRTVERFDTPESGISGTVTAFVEDESRLIWAASSDGLFRYASDRWTRLGAADGLPDAAATSLFRRPGGGIWVGTAAGIYGKLPTSSRFDLFEAAADTLRSLSLSVDSGGALWTSDPIIGVRAVGTAQVRGGDPSQSGRGYRILHDRRGHLWIGTIGQGLWRARTASPQVPPTVERATVLSGLSSDAVRSIFEDRDGNIWAGTTEGVDRLVPHRITPWTSLGLVSSIEATADQRIWVGTEDDLIRFSPENRIWAPDGTRLPLRGIRALRADRQHGLWVLALDDLVRVVGGLTTRIAYPPGIPVSWTETIASDSHSGVWVAVISGEILRDDGDRLRVFDRIDDIKDAQINSALADTKGRFWLGYSGSRVGVLAEKGHFKSYGPTEGLSPGPYYAIFEDRQGDIWVAGAGGVSRLSGDRFVHVGRAGGLPAGGVYSIAEDKAGFLWMGTSGGVIRAAREEFDAAAKGGGAMHFRLYDTSDGLAGFPALLGDHSGIRAADGTLWFVTSRGLSVVDPIALAQARVTPRVAVDELRADDQLMLSSRLPAGTAKIEVNYTAPELTYPLKMRFRYRLDGFDRDWVDAGTRRQVLYTNLPPRDYEFRVAVSSDEGRWAESATTLAFSIAPRFYQTFWFYPLCVLVGGGLIAGAWQLRLRQLRRQFSLVLGERVRLSRELHDTLLQSLVGVALEFDAVSKSLESSPATARERVVKIREHVEEYIREARRSIWSLRSPALETGDLIEALRESATRATADHEVALDFEVEGERRRLGPQIEHQVLRVGQEAILNAARHANPESIRVLLRYEPNAVVLRVADDGVGFDPARTAEGTTNHYGIITMRERAQQAGGEVTISSASGRGTIVEARVPTGREPAEED